MQTFAEPERRNTGEDNQVTIIQALENKQIRYSQGYRFTTNDAGNGGSYHFGSFEELTETAPQIGPNRGYLGSRFVRFDDELAGIPLSLEHTWAAPVFVGGELIGALVIWSSDENEAAWRVNVPQPVSFDEFNVRRHEEDNPNTLPHRQRATPI